MELGRDHMYHVAKVHENKKAHTKGKSPKRVGRSIATKMRTKRPMKAQGKQSRIERISIKI